MLIQKRPGFWEQEEGTRFTVVDLDVISRRRLTALVTALQAAKVRNGSVSVLYEGPWGRGRYSAHFELSHWPDSPADRQIQGLIALIKKLPKHVRALWDGAQSREFNMAIEADLKPHSREFKLSPRTIALVAAVRATIVITVYAPEPPAPPLKPRKKAR
jgi:hypothetical protein